MSSASHSVWAVAGERSRRSLPFYGACMLLFGALIAAPLAFGAVQTWAWTGLAIASVLMLVLWATEAAEQGTLRIAWSPLYIPSALFFLLATIQFLGHLTADPFATRESLLKLATDLLFFFLSGQLMTTASGRTWRALGFTALIFAFALALFAVLQFFSSPGLIYWSVRPRWGGWIFGPYVNHNHYAGLMEMLIPLSLGYVLSRQGNPQRNISLAIAGVFPVVSVLLSGSRGGLIALLAELLILSAIFLRHAPKGSHRAFMAVGALGIAATLLLFSWMDVGTVSKRLATVFQLRHPPDAEAEYLERKTAAGDCLRILRDHPWAGTGLGSFENVYPAYRSLAGDSVWEHAHNDYAEALAETGLTGGLLILSALVIFLRLVFRNLGERLNHEAGWIRLGAALGCCGLLVHSFVDFNLHIPANAVWFAVCAACAISGQSSAGFGKEKFHALR